MLAKRRVPIRFILILSMAPFAWLGCAHSRLGLKNGKLAPCPASPNCVSTRAEDDLHRIAPLKYQGSQADARARLLDVIRSMPRTRVKKAEEDYIHATFRSRIFQFIDDVEFQFDDSSKTIHFRSASRLGYSDLGVNRQRMEAIRHKFENAH